jgi:LAO/AO transport system kinase
MPAVGICRRGLTAAGARGCKFARTAGGLQYKCTPWARHLSQHQHPVVSLPGDATVLSEKNIALADGILQGSRSSLAKAITLMESSRSDHREQADRLQQYLLSHRNIAASTSVWASPTFRIGVAGPPGAGKSSMIETLGMMLIEMGHKVAVIPIDPSSSVSGGSILGDKTRMDSLSKSESAYVRASPTRCILGGIAEHTADVVSLCESGGYDTVIVESVGLGQSEIELDQAVDLFILLLPPGAGDDLQASKKGVMEFADLVIVNKADGALLPLARAALSDYKCSVSLIRRKCLDWEPRVQMVRRYALLSSMILLSLSPTTNTYHSLTPTTH